MEVLERSPLYIQGDPEQRIENFLERWYSKGEIRRLLKQNGIKIGRPHLNEVWIKIGKQLIIIQKNEHFIATQAQIWWEYHNELMPKVIKWQNISE